MEPIAAALGIATGATMAACIAASCTSILPDLRILREVSGTLFSLLLLRTASRLLRASPIDRRINVTDDILALREPYLIGCSAAVCNPLSGPFFVSFFVSHACSPSTAATACLTIFLLAAMWFSVLGVVLFHIRSIQIRHHWQEFGRQALALALIVVALRTFWLTVSL
ncbi:hypothetical protein M8523_27440 [Hyphomicrobiales bacterium BP6-180914]|uniref:Uncharacterized protein n=1 Tax=Lichenifustis flavocetrariae TaxID=2949735 RepID=A0AA42CQR8_9HYPH|nr:hypothetical protein [Lichenifustis flavocetrariae]MCW6511705.1 hypothetical protein [Lichenifustis flavocetrariae]